MKVLCVSDTTSSLAFSPNVAEIYAGTDLILSCGDMPLESHDYLSTMLRRDVYYVYGNHNLPVPENKTDKTDICYTNKPVNEFNRKFYGFLLDGKCVRDKRTGLLIAGLGGSMRYNEGESQYTEAQMKLRISRLVPTLLWNKSRYGRYLDILVTHAAPFGIGDGPDQCHMGFKCFLDFMKRYKPSYLVHGHVHLHDLNTERVSHYMNTTVINIFGSYMLNFDMKKKTGEADNGR